MGTFPPWSTRRVNLNSILGNYAPTYNEGLTSLTLQDFIILMNLLVGTSGYNIRYTSEYIPKLQIHQHSLLTRKEFSWHNSLAQFFVSRSSSKLDHNWIIIKVGSSSKMDHHWIIIKARSSLDHHHHCFAISINWCYLSILLFTRSST